MLRLFQNAKGKWHALNPSLARPTATGADISKCKQTSAAPQTQSEKCNSPKTFDEIPGSPETNALAFLLRYTPLFGGLNLEKIHEIGFEKFKTFGSIRKENIPKRFRVVIPYDPNDIEKVFRNEGKCPMRPGFSAVKYYRNKHRHDFHGKVGLFTEDKDEWYSIRSKTQATMMRPKVISSYMPELNHVADDMIMLMKAKRQQNLQIDLFMSKLYNWALESIGVFALDTRFGCLSLNSQSTKETEALIKAINDTIKGLTKTEFGVPVWKYFPTKGWRMLNESQSFLKDVTVKRIEDIREKLKSKKDDDNLSFLENLVSQGKLSDGELLCFIMDLFMAGIDTTSHTVAFFLYNLSKNQDIQEKLYEEIRSVISCSADEIKASDVENMKYLKACLKESMRITATLVGTSRILEDDIVISNYLVPKGTVFALQSMVTANLEMNVEEPSKFMPERWLKESDGSSIHRFAFFPFGYGPRMCIGKRLAEQEIYILITKILMSFKVKYEDRMGIITRVVNIPDKPLHFEFCDR